MGDIFEYLFGGITYSIKRNQHIIDKLNLLSLKYEVYYFEGNHDFNLKNIFPNMIVFALEAQPVLFMRDNKKVLVSHGDWDENIGYKIYCKVIRNPCVLKVLNLVDRIIDNKISKKIILNQMGKNKCYKIDNFEEKIKNKISKLDANEVIEGHYHQDKKFHFDNKLYINLPAFVCTKIFVKSHSIIPKNKTK